MCGQTGGKCTDYNRLASIIHLLGSLGSGGKEWVGWGGGGARPGGIAGKLPKPVYRTGMNE